VTGNEDILKIAEGLLIVLLTVVPVLHVIAERDPEPLTLPAVTRKDTGFNITFHQNQAG
jgi:hypothetical protein